MAGSWIDDFTAIMGSTAEVLEKTGNLLNPTTASKTPTTAATTVDQSPKQALVETKTQLPSGNTAVIVAAVVVGLFLLLEW